MDLSVVTATYNEKENISNLIKDIEKIFKENNIDGEIIVVDDSSPDGTGEIVLQLKKNFHNIVLIKRPPRSGIGSAYGDGVKASKGKVVITMDADYSHHPKNLLSMYLKAREGFMVTGSRFLNKASFETKFYRHVGTTLLNMWIKFFFKLGITDYTNGYLAIPKDYLNKIINKGKIINIYPFDSTLYGIPIFTMGSYLGFNHHNTNAPYVFRKSGITKINTIQGGKEVVTNALYTLKLFYKINLMKLIKN